MKLPTPRRLAVVLFVSSIVASAGAQGYKFTPIDNLNMISMNNYGQIGGLSLETQTPGLWTPSTPNGTSGVLTTIPFPVYDHSYTWCINDFGQMVGTHNATQDDFYGVAYLWTPNTANGTTGTLTDIAPELGGPGYSINNFGQITLGTIKSGATTTVNLWTPGAQHGTAGAVSPLPGFTYHKLNDRGQIAGNIWINDFAQSRVAIWTPTSLNGATGTMQDIGSLDPAGNTYIYDINASGQIAGSSGKAIEPGSSTRVLHAYIWTPNTPNGSTGTMLDIEPTPERKSEIFNMNDSGDAVGVYTDPGEFVKPFAYIKGQFMDINALVPAGSGIVVTWAQDINNAGQMIVSGFINGHLTGFLVSPKTASDSVVDLKTNVNTLVINGALLPANGQSLYAKLNSAQQKIASGNKAGAITDLQAFINQVTTFVKTGKLSASAGQALIDAAKAIIKVLQA